MAGCVADQSVRSPPVDAPAFEWRLQHAGDPELAPRTSVYAAVGGVSHFVAEVDGHCRLIRRSDFVRFRIPPEAMSACGAWWAGGGDYFYAIRTDDRYVVMRATPDEANPDPWTYSTQLVIPFP